MIIPVLTLALALAAPSRSAEPTAVMVAEDPNGTLSPERAQAIGRLAPNWAAYMNRANRMLDGYSAAAARDGWNQASMDNLISQIRVLISDIARTEAVVADMARKAVRASEPPSAARTRREGAVASVFEGRMLTIYANLVPRVLNEACKDQNGRYIGRLYAGAEWSVPSFTYEEGVYYSRWQVLRAGFTREEYEEFGARARASLGLPPAKP